MKYRFDWSPDIDAVMEAELRQGKLAVTKAMQTATNRLKLRWRDQVKAAGLGKRLAFTIQGEAFPGRSASLNAAGMVWSKAPHIISAYEHGATIRGTGGNWLAIPTPQAGVGRRGTKITPDRWEQQHGQYLRYVATRTGKHLLVADDARTTKRKGVARPKRGRRRKDGILTGAQTVVIFVLVPQVKLKKRLDLAGAVSEVSATVPGLINGYWKD